MIKNLTPGLPEVGKIKIGYKGEEMTSKGGKRFQPPKKLDHFLITGLERGADGNFLRNEEIHAKVGDNPKELAVRLLYDDPDLNFLTRYVCYDGMKLHCTGDGERASRSTGKNGERADVKCPCERLGPDFEGRGKCKPSGVLSVILDESPIVGGVWKLRTTSFNSVRSIMSSLSMISRITGGILSGLPLTLTHGKKTTTLQKTDKLTTFPVVGLIYNGSVLELAEAGQRTALQFASYRSRIEHIEEIARAQITKEIGIYTEGETDEDIAAEFYPEEVAGSAEESLQAKTSDKLETLKEQLKPEPETADTQGDAEPTVSEEHASPPVPENNPYEDRRSYARKKKGDLQVWNEENAGKWWGLASVEARETFRVHFLVSVGDDPPQCRPGEPDVELTKNEREQAETDAKEASGDIRGDQNEYETLIDLIQGAPLELLAAAKKATGITMPTTVEGATRLLAEIEEQANKDAF